MLAILIAGAAIVAVGVLAGIAFALIAALVAVLCGALVAAARLRRQAESLHGQARGDEITGFGNQRAFWELVPQQVERAGEEQRPLSLIALEIDHLGDLNELYGHLVGDRMLKSLAAAIRRHSPPQAQAFRYGGADLVILAPELDEEAGLVLAEQVRGSIGLSKEPSPEFTVSAGVASLNGDEEGPPIVVAAQLFDDASRALRTAKRAGRDQAMPASASEVDGLELIDPEVGAARRAAMEMARATLGASDAATAEHSDDVVALAEVVGDEMGIGGAAKSNMLLAAHLHDIGKIAVPPEILNKPAELDPNEWEVIRQHTVVGEGILRAVPELAPSAEIVRHSHERWDGDGYPDGLREEDIPLESRVILCADAFHAIRSDRPYRSGRGASDALKEIRSCAGTQFDPAVVEALERVAITTRVGGRRLPPRVTALLLAMVVGLAGTAVAEWIGLIDVLPGVVSAGGTEQPRHASPGVDSVQPDEPKRKSTDSGRKAGRASGAHDHQRRSDRADRNANGDPNGNAYGQLPGNPGRGVAWGQGTGGGRGHPKK